MPAKLTLFPTEGTSRHFVFREGKNHFLGRDPSSDLLLEDPRVSVQQLIGAQRGFVLLAQPTGEVDAEVAFGFPPFEQLDDRFEESFLAIETVLKTGQPVVTSSWRPDPLMPGKKRSSSDLGKGARACVPLKADARVIGFLYVDGREKGGVFTDLDLEILEALADHAALLMGSVRLESPIRVL